MLGTGGHTETEGGPEQEAVHEYPFTRPSLRGAARRLPDVHVPGRRAAVIESLGAGQLVGCSWLFKP
ncbi:hypothetical protein ABIC27_002360 [Streptomyces sp. PvR034]